MQPALIGGLVAGVLSALPLVNFLNACCCLWVVSGGIIAAYLLQERDPNPIQVGDGALVGLMAGVVGALVNFVLSIPVTLLLAPMQRALMERIIERGNMIAPLPGLTTTKPGSATRPFPGIAESPRWTMMTCSMDGAPSSASSAICLRGTIWPRR